MWTQVWFQLSAVLFAEGLQKWSTKCSGAFSPIQREGSLLKTSSEEIRIADEEEMYSGERKKKKKEKGKRKKKPPKQQQQQESLHIY